MEDPRKQAFAPYVRCLADMMRLNDWDIEVQSEPPPPGSVASTRICDSYRESVILLSEEFLDSKPEDQRETLAHELTHLVFQRPYVTARNELNGSAWRAFERDMEYAVEEFAQILAPALPLPGGIDKEEPSECQP